jgi:lysophospholipase L1-like esterase
MVVVGDSLGLGYGERVPELEVIGWADRLALALRALQPGMRYTNLATVGLTTNQVAKMQVRAALAMKPDLILLVAGGNDVLARRWDPSAFRDTYAPMLEQLVASGATVLTTTWHNMPLAVPMPARRADALSSRLAEASVIVRELSEHYGATCVDFWQLPNLLDEHCYGSDGVHPNAQGYLRVAHVLAQSLARLAGSPVPHDALYTPMERATQLAGVRRAESLPPRRLSGLSGQVA